MFVTCLVQAGTSCAVEVAYAATSCLFLFRYKDAGGKSMETLEAVKNSKATLEAQLTTQRSLIESMRQELGSAKVELTSNAHK